MYLSFCVHVHQFDWSVQLFAEWHTTAEVEPTPMLTCVCLQLRSCWDMLGLKGYQALQQILPVCSESGESGRDSVGDSVPTPRLFLLLLRQLEHKRKKKKGVNTNYQPDHTSLISHHFEHVFITCCNTVEFQPLKKHQFENCPPGYLKRKLFH